MARAVNVLKMRGSWHGSKIREYIITDRVAQIQDSFKGYERILSGSPSRSSIDEKSELSRIIRGVQPE